MLLSATTLPPIEYNCTTKKAKPLGLTFPHGCAIVDLLTTTPHNVCAALGVMKRANHEIETNLSRRCSFIIAQMFGAVK